MTAIIAHKKSDKAKDDASPPRRDLCEEVTRQYTHSVIFALAAVALTVSPSYFGADWAGTFRLQVAHLVALGGSSTSLASVFILVVAAYFIARGDRRREVSEWMQRYELATLLRKTLGLTHAQAISADQANREKRRAELVVEIADFEQTSKGYAVFARVVFMVALLAVVLVDRLM